LADNNQLGVFLYVVKQEEASSREEFGYKAAAIADMQK